MFATETVLPDNAVPIPVEPIVVNVFQDKLVSTESVLEPVLLNAPEPSMVNPRLVDGIDAVGTVEVAQPTSDAKTEFVCATLNAKARTVVPMVVVELVEPVFPLSQTENLFVLMRLS